jgi:molybdenum ABC transporter molybdate-binding protein
MSRLLYATLHYIPSVFCLLVLFAQPAFAQRDSLRELSVLADSALTVPLTRLASSYTRESQVSVTLTFAPSFEQALAIEDGEQADILITAHPEPLVTLQQKGLYDVYSVTPLIEGRLSLVSSYPKNPKLFGLDVEALRTLRKQPDFLLAIANKAAAAEGYYAAQILKHLPSNLFLTDHTAQMQDAEDVLNFMSTVPSYGILFESDVLQRQNIRTIAPFPKEWHDPAIFTGVVVAGGSMAAARNFLSYLKSPKAQRIFIKYGFYPAAEPKQAKVSKP